MTCYFLPSSSYQGKSSVLVCNNSGQSPVFTCPLVCIHFTYNVAPIYSNLQFPIGKLESITAQKMLKQKKMAYSKYLHVSKLVPPSLIMLRNCIQITHDTEECIIIKQNAFRDSQHYVMLRVDSRSRLCRLSLRIEPLTDIKLHVYTKLCCKYIYFHLNWRQMLNFFELEDQMKQVFFHASIAVQWKPTLTVFLLTIRDHGELQR